MFGGGGMGPVGHWIFWQPWFAFREQPQNLEFGDIFALFIVWTPLHESESSKGAKFWSKCLSLCLDLILIIPEKKKVEEFDI